MAAFTHRLDQVTYPKMERQDLTQGQLGSFKFTPTDEVRPVFSKTSPTLAHQFSSSHNPISLKDFPALTQPNVSTNKRSPPNQAAGTSLSPTRFNSSLFDTYFKQDLAKSRLQLGPNALRAAIDGTPPVTQASSMDHNIFGYTPPADFVPRHMAMPNANGALSVATQNPIPSSAILPTEATILDSTFFQSSLVRALATEQQAHQITKNVLENEKALRVEAEALVQTYVEQNRSLVASVNMLKSVVQHNVKKEQMSAAKPGCEQARSTPTTTTRTSYDPIERPVDTILYDAVKDLRRRDRKTTSKIAVDNNQIFDLDLVKTHGSSALRRHFSTDLEHRSPETLESNEQERDFMEYNVDVASRRTKSDESWELAGTTTDAVSDTMDLDDDSPVLKPTNGNMSKLEASNNVKLMAMPFDPHVRWHQEPIFDDHQDKSDRLGHCASLFVKYPVRYFPNKSATNIYRTVMMDFLPEGTTYKELLDNVRGGPIEDVQLFGPIGQSTTFMTARVVFNYELGARNLYMQGQSPGIAIKGKRIRVWQVLEATYPRNSELENNIFEKGYTRFLLIDNAAQSALDKLPEKLARQMKSGTIIEIGEAFDGIPMIEFTSVSECTKALELLMKDRDFGGSKFDFEEDPCGDDY